MTGEGAKPQANPRPINSWQSTEFIAYLLAVVFAVVLVFNDRLELGVEIFTWSTSIYIGQAGVRKAATTLATKEKP